MRDMSAVDSNSTIRRFESSQVSQAVRRSGMPSLIVREMPANSGLFEFIERSPASRFRQRRGEIADSLRPTFEIFPFFGDASQRPGAISTAWCGMQLTCGRAGTLVG